MGVDYEKCEDCGGIYPDCGDNYPRYITVDDEGKRSCPECINGNGSLIPILSEKHLLVNFDGQVYHHTDLDAATWKILALRCNYSSKVSCRVLYSDALEKVIDVLSLTGEERRELAKEEEEEKDGKEDGKEEKGEKEEDDKNEENEEKNGDRKENGKKEKRKEENLISDIATNEELWAIAERIMSPEECEKRAQARREREMKVQHYHWDKKPYDFGRNREEQLRIIHALDKQDQDFCVEECSAEDFMSEYETMCHEVFDVWTADDYFDASYFTVEGIEESSVEDKIAANKHALKELYTQEKELKKRIAALQTSGRKEEKETVRKFIRDKCVMVLPEIKPLDEVVDLVAQYLAQCEEAINIFAPVRNFSQDEQYEDDKETKIVVDSIIKELKHLPYGTLTLPAVESAVTKILSTRKNKRKLESSSEKSTNVKDVGEESSGDDEEHEEDDESTSKRTKY